MRYVALRAAPSSLAALAAALVSVLGVAAPRALAQDAARPPQVGASTGYNLLPLTLSLLEATRAGVAFEAVPDSRFRIVRHMQTRFPCAFQPDSEAVVTLVAAAEGASAGDDAVCVEQIEGTDIAYRITRHPGKSLEDVFTDAQASAGRWLRGDLVEVVSAPLLEASPHQPGVALDMPRQQLLLVGDSPQGVAMLRIAVAELADEWFVTQNYFAPLANAEAEQWAPLAGLGSALAEAAFAFQLSELKSPTTDPS